MKPYCTSCLLFLTNRKMFGAWVPSEAQRLYELGTATQLTVDVLGRETTHTLTYPDLPEEDSEVIIFGEYCTVTISLL